MSADHTITVVVVALLMLTGLVGIVLPVLPGLLLVFLATGLWALDHPDHRAWLVVVAAGLVYAAGEVTKYLVPGRRLRTAGVGTGTLVLAILLAVVGFFVIPVVGAFVGFVLGVFLVELGRRREAGSAWRATTHALRAVAASIGIELVAGFAIVLVWVIGLAALGIPS